MTFIALIVLFVMFLIWPACFTIIALAFIKEGAHINIKHTHQTECVEVPTELNSEPEQSEQNTTPTLDEVLGVVNEVLGYTENE